MPLSFAACLAWPIWAAVSILSAASPGGWRRIAMPLAVSGIACAGVTLSPVPLPLAAGFWIASLLALPLAGKAVSSAWCGAASMLLLGLALWSGGDWRLALIPGFLLCAGCAEAAFRVGAFLAAAGWVLVSDASLDFQKALAVAAILAAAACAARGSMPAVAEWMASHGVRGRHFAGSVGSALILSWLLAAAAWASVAAAILLAAGETGPDSVPFAAGGLALAGLLWATRRRPDAR